MFCCCCLRWQCWEVIIEHVLPHCQNTFCAFCLFITGHHKECAHGAHWDCVLTLWGDEQLHWWAAASALHSQGAYRFFILRLIKNCLRMYPLYVNIMVPVHYLAQWHSSLWFKKFSVKTSRSTRQPVHLQYNNGILLTQQWISMLHGIEEETHWLATIFYSSMPRFICLPVGSNVHEALHLPILFTGSGGGLQTACQLHTHSLQTVIQCQCVDKMAHSRVAFYCD